jgi:sterol desaturase/sphingolipid hydroxylase (fatty acid hydroxylase superfamily)
MKIILAFLTGMLTWTLAEYCLHRFLGHVPKRLLMRSRFHKEHKKHHFIKDYFAGTKEKAMTAAVVGPITWLLTQSLAFTVGFLMMYLVYELIHRRLHVFPPTHAYAAHMRRHHFYHHFVDETKNHGVTTPLWDLVFGTYAKPEIISVPRKLAPNWLSQNPAPGWILKP